MKANEKSEHWGKLLTAWQDSGLNQKAFCVERGISYSNFCYWRRSRASGADELGNEHIRAIEITRHTEDFLAGALSALPTSLMETQGIVLTLPGCDATITIAGRVSLVTLGRLMAACEGIADHAQAR